MLGPEMCVSVPGGKRSWRKGSLRLCKDLGRMAGTSLGQPQRSESDAGNSQTPPRQAFSFHSDPGLSKTLVLVSVLTSKGM